MMKIGVVLAVAVIIGLIGLGYGLFVLPEQPNPAAGSGIKLHVVSFGCFGQTATFSIVLTRPLAYGEPAFLNVDVRYDVLNTNSGKIVGTQTTTYLLSSEEIEHAQTTFQVSPGETCNSDSYSTGRADIVSVRA